MMKLYENYKLKNYKLLIRNLKGATKYIIPVWSLFYSVLLYISLTFSTYFFSKTRFSSFYVLVFRRLKSLLVARCSLLFACCSLFSRPSYVMKIQYKLRKNAIKNEVIVYLLLQLKSQSAREASSHLSFKGNCTIILSHVLVLST